MNGASISVVGQSATLRRVAALAAFLLSTAMMAAPSLAQEWPYAVRIEGARMHRHLVTLPDGTTLVPLMRLVPAEKDTYYWYRLESLLTTPERWPIQIPMTNIGGVFDGNGNGIPDVVSVSPWFPSGTGYYMDGFTSEATRYEPRGFTKHVVANRAVRYDGDVDNDGVFDAMFEHSAGSVYLVYGDREQPWNQYSFVDIGPRPNRDNDHHAWCVGLLSGVPCVVRAYWNAVGEPRMQLRRLNQEDLRSRRDTIRTELLHEYPTPISYVYGYVIVRGEHSWWMYSASDGPTCAKVTLDKGIELRPTNRFLGTWPSEGHYKQQGAYNDPLPKIIDPARPFILRTWGSLLPGDTAVKEGAALMRIPDPDNPEPELIAQVRTSQRPNSGLENAMLVPDMDNDGREDLLITHSYTDTAAQVGYHYFDIYLTTQILPVSVAEDLAEQWGTSRVLQARLVDGTWVVDAAVDCQPADPSAPVYNIQGAVVGTMQVHANGTTLRLVPTQSLPSQRLWVVIGTCLVRL